MHIMAPMGTPAPRALAEVNTSGSTPSCLRGDSRCRRLCVLDEMGLLKPSPR